ncbi:MAG: hypothetical protein KDK71_10360, partial [Chlamydiia bacterium]|nr:hypothetical protein [Chlamydiia bacterium]
MDKLPKKQYEQKEQAAFDQGLAIATYRLKRGLYFKKNPDYMVELQDCVATDIINASDLPLKTVNHLTKPFATEPLQQLNDHLANQLTMPVFNQVCKTFAQFKKEDPLNFGNFCKLNQEKKLSPSEKRAFLSDAIFSYGKEFGPEHADTQKVFDEVREDLLKHYSPEFFAEKGESLGAAEAPPTPSFIKIAGVFSLAQGHLNEIIQGTSKIFKTASSTIEEVNSFANPEGKKRVDALALKEQRALIAASKQWLHDHPEHSKFYENMRKLYGETTDSEEKVRIKKILDTHLAEEANQLMLRVSDGAQTVMQAMDNAGIPIPKKMRQGVNMSCAVIQTIASIPQIIFSPYEGAMGVIRGIGQIIGLSRTKQGSFTLEDLRHEQTLSKLHSIETKQLLLLQGQRKIQEMIHQLANNQVKIMQAIQALDTKLYEYMKVVDERFNQVLYNIALIRFGQDTIMKKTLKSAKALRASMENESDFDVEQNRFITYKALEIFSKKVDFLLPTTLQKVFEEVDGPGELEGYFMLGQENSHPYHQHFTALSCYYLK